LVEAIPVSDEIAAPAKSRAIEQEARGMTSMTTLKIVPPSGDVESPEDAVRRQMAEAGVKTEPTEEERTRRVMAEAHRLAGLSPNEWLIWVDRSAAELGVPVNRLTEVVKGILAQRNKVAREAKVEAKQKESRVEKEKVTTKREQARAEKETKKETERREKTEKKEAERKDKEKTKEREKEFKALLGLPSKELDARIADLATRLGEDVETLRAEFDIFADSKRDDGRIEPWPDPVDAHELLIELQAQLRRYVVADDNAKLAIALCVMFAWVHDIAPLSPLLILTSPDPDCGKTTCLGTIGNMAPQSQSAVELTGPSLYRLVDYLHPTLLIDEADKLFHRKPDLLHIVNTGWTRGTKIPRAGRDGIVHWYDPFCPKVIAMMGLSMPPTTASRGIIIKMWPKTLGEKVESFTFCDDATFEAIRRKCMRWSSDNMLKLKDAQPALPEDFNNRLATNWKILFAIAEQAGVLKEAHRAAVQLSPRTTYKRSEGVRLLEALREVFGTRESMTSTELVRQLIADPDGEWGAFRERGPITQRQVAALLAPYEIRPVVLHPTKRSDLSPRGYRRAQFNDAFARFLPPDPHIRTQPPKTKGKK
jgi:Protein of unknown function (DUF3631)